MRTVTSDNPICKSSGPPACYEEAIDDAKVYLERLGGWSVDAEDREAKSLLIGFRLMRLLELELDDALQLVMQEYNPYCEPPASVEVWRAELSAYCIARDIREGASVREAVKSWEDSLERFIIPPKTPPPGPGGRLFEPKLLGEFQTTRGEYLIEGLIPEAQITVFAAKAKEGKTTLLAHLLRTLEQGGEFCGRQVKKTRALLLTEETEGMWVRRSEELGLPGSWHFGHSLPFMGKPTLAQWTQLIAEVAAWVEDNGVALVVIDTIGNLGPGKDENANAEAQIYLAPLREITKAGAAVLLIHHHGHENERARGASALLGFADVLIDMSRTNRTDAEDKRRTLRVNGRLSDLIRTLTIRLDDDGDYVLAQDSSPGETQHKKPGTLDVLRQLAPDNDVGFAPGDFLAHWPADRKKPALHTITNTAAAGTRSGLLRCVSEGKRGQPARYARASQQDEDDSTNCPF